MDNPKVQRLVQDYEALAAETGGASFRHPIIRQISAGTAEVSPTSPSSSRKKAPFDENAKLLGSSFQKSSEIRGPEGSELGADLTFAERYMTWRYVIILLFHLSLAIFIFIRNSMPIALVCMSAPVSLIAAAEEEKEAKMWLETSPAVHNMSGEAYLDVYDELHLDPNVSISALLDQYEFVWSAAIQGMVLSSVMTFAFASPLLGSYFLTMFSTRNVAAVCSLTTAGLSLLTPFATRISVYALIGVRVLMGLFVGVVTPILGDAVAWWGPQNEKLAMMAFAFTGINVGEILVPVLSGFMCTIPVDNGWPFIFYVFGTMGFIWSVAWFYLFAPRPEEHKCITQEEKEYIFKYRANMGTDTHLKPPLRKILTSVPVWGFLFTGCFHRWNNLVVMTSLPIFLKDVLGFNVQQIGILITVVSFFKLTGSLSWVVISTKLDGYLGVRAGRKLCVVSGLLLAALNFVGSSFFHTHESRWYFFFSLLPAMLFQAVGGSTFTALPLDMGPRYAGMLNSLSVSASALTTFTGPLIISLMTRTGSASEWQRAWLVMALVYLLGGIVFLVMGDASLQPWAYADMEISDIDLEKKDVVVDGSEIPTAAGHNQSLYPDLGNNHRDHLHMSHDGAANSHNDKNGVQTAFVDTNEKRRLLDGGDEKEKDRTGPIYRGVARAHAETAN